MSEPYLFDEALFDIDGAPSPEEGLKEAADLGFLQAVITRDLKTWDGILKTAEHLGIGLISKITPRAHVPAGASAVLYLPQQDEEESVLRAMERNQIPAAVMWKDKSAPEEYFPAAQLLGLDHSAFKPSPIPSRRFDFSRYIDTLDSIQEWDVLTDMGCLQDAMTHLRGEDIRRFGDLPLKALTLLHMTLNGVPYIRYGEQYGYGGLPYHGARSIKESAPVFPSPDEQREDPNSLWHFTRDLLMLRRELPCLFSGGFRMIEKGRAFCYARISQEGDSACFVLVNLSARKVRMSGIGEVIFSNTGRFFFDGIMEPYEALILEALPDDSEDDSEN